VSLNAATGVLSVDPATVNTGTSALAYTRTLTATNKWGNTSTLGATFDFASGAEYPPTNIGTGSAWTKDLNDTFVGIDGTYAKYKYTVTGSGYGNGQYIAWANSIWDYVNGTTYGGDEWPPSGAFDKRETSSGSKSGWHVNSASATYSSTTDKTNPAILYLQLPQSIALKRYSLTSRTDPIPSQMPSKWDLQGSSNNSTWVTVDSRSGITGWSNPETREYTCSPATATAYLYFRIVVYRNNGNINLSFAELRLYA